MLAYAGRAGDAREKLKEIMQVLSFYNPVYLLYWYKSSNTEDARKKLREVMHVLGFYGLVYFFIGTKVQILTHLRGRWLRTRRLPQSVFVLLYQ
jgi:hypothetical protein